MAPRPTKPIFRGRSIADIEISFRMCVREQASRKFGESSARFGDYGLMAANETFVLELEWDSWGTADPGFAVTSALVGESDPTVDSLRLFPH